MGTSRWAVDACPPQALVAGIWRAWLLERRRRFSRVSRRRDPGAARQPAPLGQVGEPIFGFPVSFWIGRALENATLGRTNIALYLSGAARATMVGEVSSRTAFEIQESTSGTTGEALCLIRLGTSPPTECGFLFLVRSDVRAGRKGVWRARPAVSAGVRGVLAEVLRGVE